LSIREKTPAPITLPNGIVLHHVREGSGPCLIFVHGAMGDWSSWEPQWHQFTQHFDCISYSRRYSSPNPNVLTTSAHNALVDAEDLEGLMGELDIKSAILVGSSYGGFTALALAARSPARVDAIISVEAPMMRYAEMTAEGADTARAFRENFVLPAREAFERGNDKAGVQILTGGIVGSDPRDIPAHILEQRMRNVRAARSLSLSNDEFPLLNPATLAGLKVPVLLMSGTDTAPIHAAIFSGLSAAMPNAQTLIVDGCGHSVSQQAPSEFNSAVISFLSENGLLHKRT
jgi:pimeloyl-ACP methyl ester carboxylesterase